MLSQDGSSITGSLFLCNLGPGEIFGDEILASHGIFRSVHDVFVDNSAPSPASPPPTSSSGLTGSAAKSASSPVTNNPGGAQLLLLDRQLFHSINSKTDTEIEKELHVRLKLAKSKWHSAERKITRKLSQASVNRDHNSGGGGKATSKLFDLFKNILNQRCYLTMRTIADIPLLRDLPDASKREICLAARFEALERGMNAYKENGAHNSAPQYYILISGRLGLYAKNLNGTFYSHSSSNNGGGGSGNSSSSSATGGTTVTAPTGAENCLREVLVGDGFGEFEILVPELPNRCISALALESCRLLSFPASAFLKQWPHVASMKSDIEYLRTRVPFFSRLELEKTAYLYTTLSFQTFTRGSNIFEQNHAVSNHFSNSGELYLLKEGSCSIRQRVVLDSKQSAGKVFVSSATKTPEASRSGSDSINRRHATQQKLPTHRPHHPEKHLFRVMVTVADVCDGHLFWIDGGGGDDATFPFTLQAVSASVTITNIAIDKLRAILPRTQLAALERASNQMTALYNQQYAMAQHAVVALMNEKRAAQMGMTSNPPFFPMLNFQSPQKAIFSPATATNSSTTSVSCDTSIPYSRLLMSKPVDLVALQDQERNAIQRPNPENQLIVADGNTSISQSYAAREWREAVDAAYRDQHLSEHYQLENGLPNSTLMGSFPDDFSLRRRRRSIEQRALEANNSPRALAQRTTRLYSPQEPQSNVSSSHLKQDECMEPESTMPIVNSTTQVGGTTPTKLNDSASRIHLEVKVPIFHNLTRTLNPRVPTPPSSARPKCRSEVLAATSSSSNMTPRSPRFPSGFQEVRGGNGGNTSSDDTGFYDLEIDLRALLRAEMTDAEAPMRAIKLEPSLSKANALGQYLAFSAPTPATHPALQHLPANSSFPKPKFSVSTPFKIFSRAKSTVKHTPVVPFSDGGSTTPRVSNQATLLHSEQASVRKQGFLCVVAVLHPDTPLVSILSRATQQHRRRFFSLVDNVLVEFPENLAINGEPLDTTRLLNKYPLDERSGVSEVPITAIAAGEAYAVTLRISFVLAVDANTRLILTAESAMEKKKWMNELHQACALGPRVPMHQKILHAQQDVQLYNSNSSSSAPKTPRTSSQSFRGQGRFTSHHNAAYTGADLVLQVEYRIG